MCPRQVLCSEMKARAGSLLDQRSERGVIAQRQDRLASGVIGPDVLDKVQRSLNRHGAYVMPL